MTTEEIKEALSSLPMVEDMISFLKTKRNNSPGSEYRKLTKLITELNKRATELRTEQSIKFLINSNLEY